MCILVRVSSGKQEPLQVLCRLEEIQVRELEDCTTIGRIEDREVRKLLLKFMKSERWMGGRHRWLSVNLSRWFTGWITRATAAAHLPCDFAATAVEPNGLSPSTAPKSSGSASNWLKQHRGKGVLENLPVGFPCQTVETTKAPWWCWAEDRQHIIQHKRWHLKLPSTENCLVKD